MKNIGFLFLFAALLGLSGCKADRTYLTLIPDGEITDKVVLDIRAGIKNNSSREKIYKVELLMDGKSVLVKDDSVKVAPNKGLTIRYDYPAEGDKGEHTITLKVNGKTLSKNIMIYPDVARTLTRIDGAFAGLYHWSEQEGKMWNPALKTLTASQWKEMVHSMTKLGFSTIVVQETWRNEQYCGKHDMETTGYTGKAFYPSKLYPGRMDINCKDPLEAILTQADKEGMNVFVGVGMYAWFDYTKASLEWHKNVARELFERYGRHESFYGFYVSEEGMGSLDSFEADPAKKDMRKREMIDFFKDFTAFCHDMAPSKPVMVCQNGWGIGESLALYPEFLENVDITCPFAFNRMPAGDLTADQAIGFLQRECNNLGCHLWFDLEAFEFDEAEGYLVPRPIKDIVQEIMNFGNFEKVICYQYPGVFCDPEASVLVGQDSSKTLFEQYRKYYNRIQEIHARHLD